MFLGKIQSEYNTLDFSKCFIKQLKNMSCNEGFGRCKINRHLLLHAINYINKINTDQKHTKEEIKGLLICYAVILQNEDNYDNIHDGYLCENNNINCYKNILNEYCDDTINYFVSINNIKYAINNLIIKLLLNNIILFNDYCNNYNEYLQSINKYIIIVYNVLSSKTKSSNHNMILLKKNNYNLYDFPIETNTDIFYNKLKHENILNNDKYKIFNGNKLNISIIITSILSSKLIDTKSSQKKLYSIPEESNVQFFNYINNNYLLIEENKLIELSNLFDELDTNLNNEDFDNIQNINISSKNVSVGINNNNIYVDNINNISINVLAGIKMFIHFKNYIERICDNNIT